MKDNYFRTLLACGVVSIALLIMGTFLGQQPWVAILGGVLPLIYYHLSYLAPRAKAGGLGQSAVDSVYYFGFLVTVAALSISAVFIAVHGAAANLTTVVYQFGAGLMATAYAVIARMHLSSFSTVLDATSPEALMDRYMKRSLELVDNAEAANARMQEYVQVVVERTAEFDSLTRQRAEKVMTETVGVFARELTATLNGALGSIKEVREMVADLSMTTAQTDLARNIKELLSSVTRVNDSLDELATKSLQGVQGTGNVVRMSAEVETALGRLHQSVDALTGEQGALRRSVGALTQVSTALEQGSIALSTTVNSVKEAAESIQAVAPAFQSMRSVSKKVQEQLVTLEQVAARLEDSLKPLTVATGSVMALGQGLNDLANALPPLTARANSLGSELHRAEESAQRLNEHLTGLGPRSTVLTQLSGQIEAALTKIADSVTALVHNVQELTATDTDMTRLTEALSEVVVHMKGLQPVADNVQRGLAELAVTAQSANQTVGTSSQALSIAVATAADKIADDLRRSTHAAAMLTDRLVQVAQTIIDRTRQQQGMSK